VTVLAPPGAHPAQRHAEVLRLDDNTDAARREVALNPVGDLLRQPLLYLRPAREHLDNACQLRQPEDAPARELADVRDADERQEMVLADRVHRMPRASTSSS
jgi:hypothetical protein